MTGSVKYTVGRETVSRLSVVGGCGEVVEVGGDGIAAGVVVALVSEPAVYAGVVGARPARTPGAW